MRVVVYESMFGCTRAVAEAVARGLGGSDEVAVVDVTTEPDLPADLDLLVVGGPTHAFSMSRPNTRADAASQAPDSIHVPEGRGIREWIAQLPHVARPVAVATFDTKVRHPRLPGSAAKAAGKALAGRGYRLIARPETFDVQGTQGPLVAGEEARAEAWGRRLSASTTTVA